MGRHEEAIPELNRAIELDPLYVYYRTSLANTYLPAHRYDEANKCLQETAKLSPDLGEAHYYLAYAYALKGEFNEAFAELKRGRAVRNPPSESVYLANLAQIEAMAGKRHEALKLVRQVRALVTNVTQPTAAASLYLAIGDENEAFRWLENALKERDPKLPRDRWYPEFDPLHSNPRFQALMRRMNLPPM